MLRALRCAIAAALIVTAAALHAQSAPPLPYHVECDASAGPFFSRFVKHPTGLGERPQETGIDGIARILWHPDHLLSVGLLSGFIEFLSDDFVLTDSLTSGRVRGVLTAVPVMFDVTMQNANIEVGAGLGGYVVSTMLDDRTVSRSSRFELGVLAHLSYHLPIGLGLSVGPQLIFNLLSYRGIVSFAPQVEIKYTILTY